MDSASSSAGRQSRRSAADSPQRHEVLRRLEWMTAAGDAQLWVADGSGVLWRQPTPENNAGNRVADRSGATTPPFLAQRMSSPSTHATSSLGVGPGHDAPHSAGGSGQRVRAWRQPRPCRWRCRGGALTRRPPFRCRRRRLLGRAPARAGAASADAAVAADPTQRERRSTARGVSSRECPGGDAARPWVGEGEGGRL